MELTTEWAQYLFALVVPVIILYLLRPRPKELHIPSLMFIVEIEQRRRFRSFFKKILKDPLLLMQLLGICLLVLAVAGPFYQSEETKKVTMDVAIAIDVSASMGAENRFNAAMGAADAIISELRPDDKVSIIIAENIPIVAIRQEDKVRARAALASVKQRATPSGMGGAILLASDIIKGSNVEKKVYAISDFSNYDGLDPLAAKRTAFASGVSVDLIKVGSGGENAGIIGSRPGRSLDKCFMEVLVKNYGALERSVDASFMLDGQASDSVSKSIMPGSSEVFYLSSECSSGDHKAYVAISPPDAMLSDNYAYSLMPKSKGAKILLIRERGGSAYLKYALESLDGVQLEEAYPPVFPQDYGQYDAVVFQDASGQNILGGTFGEIRRYVEGGGSLVVLGFKGLLEVPPGDLEGLLPVAVIDESSSGAAPSQVFEHQILRDVDIGDAGLTRFLYADEQEGSITVAEIAGSPLITMWDLGGGKVIYAGFSMNTSWSDFYSKPSFPIFWYNVLYWLSGGDEAAKDANFKTGETLPSYNETRRVRKPSGEVMEGDILLDDAGFYEFIGSGEGFSASLLNEKESNITSLLDSGSSEVSSGYAQGTKVEKVNVDLFWLFAAAGLLVILAEWFYYKRRGSL